MSLPETFKNLKLDTWYKAFVYLGGVALLTSLFVEVRGLTNGQLQLLSFGLFLIGIGEWKNHKTASWIKPPNAYTGGPALLSAKVRQPDMFGITCDFIGGFLLLTGVVFVIIGIIKN